MAKLIVMFSKFVSASSLWLNSLLCLVSLFLHHCHGLTHCYVYELCFFIIVMAKLIVMLSKFVSSLLSWLNSLLCL